MYKQNIYILEKKTCQDTINMIILNLSQALWWMEEKTFMKVSQDWILNC